jgi:hypothetical protein
MALEMQQNASRSSWSLTYTEKRLRTVTRAVHRLRRDAAV